jgi:hypothetical protein
MNIKLENYFKIIFIFLVLIYSIVFLMLKINLTSADLGRHLKNGEIILNSFLNWDIKTFSQILKTNFYSYSEENYRFINHHWLGGLIFYVIYKIFDFGGLHLFFIILNLIIFLFFLKIAIQESNFLIAGLFFIFLIPLLTFRIEVRPEVFSYFLFSLYFLILLGYKNNDLNYRFLFILPILEIFWVNLHIYFIFGPFLIFLFLFDLFFIEKDKEKSKILFLVFILTSLLTLINPNFLSGVLIPFTIFKSYGYPIIENQSIWFLAQRGLFNFNHLIFILVLLINILSFIWAFIIYKNKNFNFMFFMISTFFGLLSFWAIRNILLFGLFSLVSLAYNFNLIFNFLGQNYKFYFYFLLIFLILTFSIFSIIYSYLFFKNFGSGFGIGLLKNNLNSLQFLKNNNISGPIFNNYDVGSFLIYGLWPKEKVFVDNRPEAYSFLFLKEIYIPMQENEKLWKKQDEKYNFNVIIFNWHDLTNWGQDFLIRRINDSNWAPVYVDNNVLIFLKNNELNKNIIEKYKLPKNIFSISH